MTASQHENATGDGDELDQLAERVLPAGVEVTERVPGMLIHAVVAHTSAAQCRLNAIDADSVIDADTRTMLRLLVPDAIGEIILEAPLTAREQAMLLTGALGQYAAQNNLTASGLAAQIARDGTESWEVLYDVEDAATAAMHTGTFGHPITVDEPWSTLAVLLCDASGVDPGDTGYVNAAGEMLAELIIDPALVNVAARLCADTPSQEARPGASQGASQEVGPLEHAAPPLRGRRARTTTPPNTLPAAPARDTGR